MKRFVRWTSLSVFSVLWINVLHVVAIGIVIDMGGFAPDVFLASGIWQDGRTPNRIRVDIGPGVLDAEIQTVWFSLDDHVPTNFVVAARLRAVPEFRPVRGHVELMEPVQSLPCGVMIFIVITARNDANPRANNAQPVGVGTVLTAMMIDFID